MRGLTRLTGKGGEGYIRPQFSQGAFTLQREFNQQHYENICIDPNKSQSDISCRPQPGR
jgi:hypothetical protein